MYNIQKMLEAIAVYLVLGVIGIILAIIATIYFAKDSIQVYFADPVTLPIDGETRMPIYDVNSDLEHESPQFLKTVGDFPYILTGGRMGTVLSRNMLVVDSPTVKDAKQIQIKFSYESAYIPNSCMDKIQADYDKHEKEVYAKLNSYEKQLNSVKFSIDVPQKFSIKTSCPKVALYTEESKISGNDDINFEPEFKNVVVNKCLIERGQWNNSCPEKTMVYKSTISLFSFGIGSSEVEELTAKVNKTLVPLEKSEVPEPDVVENVKSDIADNEAKLVETEASEKLVEEAKLENVKKETSSKKEELDTEMPEPSQEVKIVDQTEQSVEIDKQQKSAQCVLAGGC